MDTSRYALCASCANTPSFAAIFSSRTDIVDGKLVRRFGQAESHSCAADSSVLRRSNQQSAGKRIAARDLQAERCRRPRLFSPQLPSLISRRFAGEGCERNVRIFEPEMYCRCSGLLFCDRTQRAAER